MQDEASSQPESRPANRPEEIRSDVTLRIGRSITLQASARVTPAGIVAAGVTTLLVTLAVVALAPRLRALFDRQPRPR